MSVTLSYLCSSFSYSFIPQSCLIVRALICLSNINPLCTYVSPFSQLPQNIILKNIYVFMDIFFKDKKNTIIKLVIKHFLTVVSTRNDHSAKFTGKLMLVSLYLVRSDWRSIRVTFCSVLHHVRIAPLSHPQPSNYTICVYT
jgi:hypothetical protein